MLRSFRVQNFKSISNTGTLELGLLNVFIGVNNSGKSSILAALLLLKQSLELKRPDGGLLTSGPLVDLGSYLDVVPGTPSTTPLSISFTLDRNLVSTPFLTVVGEKKVKVEHYNYDSFDLTFRYDTRKNNVSVGEFVFRDTLKNFEATGTLTSEGWRIKGLPPEVRRHVTVEMLGLLPVLVVKGQRPKNDNLAHRVLGYCLRSSYRVQVISRAFDALMYVGPVRSRIPRYEVRGTTSSFELSPTGQNLMQVLGGTGQTQKAALAALNRWLDREFHVLKHIRLRRIDPGGTVRALVADDPAGNRNINLAGTGSGISQLVPVVVQSVLTSANGCLVVEQPEVHLHPAAQTRLADLFVEQSKRGTQFIIETHSEHLLLRIRRRVAEGKLLAKDVRIFAVEKIHGETRVKQLSLGDNGHFTSWPEGFFDEGYEEAMALAKASARRKIVRKVSKKISKKK